MRAPARYSTFAREALARIGAPAVRPLVRLLGDDDLGYPAGQVLVEIGEPAIRALERVAREGEPRAQYRAKKALKAIRGE